MAPLELRQYTLPVQAPARSDTDESLFLALFLASFSPLSFSCHLASTEEHFIPPLKGKQLKRLEPSSGCYYPSESCPPPPPPPPLAENNNALCTGAGSKKPSASFGAVQRQQSSAPVASWQGMRTKGAGRAVKPGAAAAPRAARPAADRAAAGTKKQASGQKEGP